MIDKVRDTLASVTEDAVAIAQLQVEVGYLKMAEFDHLARTVVALRETISTLERNVDELVGQLRERDKRIDKLRNEYEALQGSSDAGVKSSRKDQRLALFKSLQLIATQLPSMRHAIDEGADVSAADVVALLAPLDEALDDMGFEAITQPGATVKFDPQRHRAVGKGARSVEPGDSVRVQYVGYLHEGDVVVKAHVTAVSP